MAAATIDAGPGWFRRVKTEAPGLVAAAVTFGLGLWRIGVPTPHFDAPLYTNVGRDYVAGDLTANLEHPPLAKYAFGLSQALLGDGITSARVASLLAGTVTTFLLWRIVGLLAGRGPATVAALAWALLPQSLSSAELRTVIERPETTALLEPITTMFMVAAVLAGLFWLRDGGRWWPLAVGALVGLAAASKLVGALVGPPIVVAVWSVRRSRHAIAGGFAAGLASLVVWGATYAPFGRTANEAWQQLWDFQTGHLDVGHRQYVAGRVYDDPPWWSPLWHHVDADGWILTTVLVVLIVAAMRHRGADPSVRLVGAVALTIVAALCLASVQLRHYRYVALPFVHILAAVGAATLWKSRNRISRIVLTASMAVVTVAAVLAVGDRLTVGPDGYGAVGDALAEAGLDDAPVHVFGTPHLQRHYLGNRVSVGVPGGFVPADEPIVIERNWELRFADDRPTALLIGRQPVELGPVTLWLPAG